MNGHCSTCNIEKECGYEFKPTECCDYRKYREPSLHSKPIDRYSVLLKKGEFNP
jgi:hypothetical protein